MRHSIGNGIHAPQVEGDPRLVADGRQMQHEIHVAKEE